MTDESLIGAWLGIAYVTVCLTGWIFIDWWLHNHHHEYITTEARERLQEGGWGAIIFVGLVGMILAIGLFHFFYQRAIQ